MSPFFRMAAGVSLAFVVTGVVASPARPVLLQQLLEDRRAVESVLWKHRIWPSSNPLPKPEFTQALPDNLLQLRVREDLARNAALGAIWNRPISGSELQVELNRMAAHTKDSALLREIFSALNNDPERIAYALALPALADRRLRSWYAQDDRFHGSLRAAAELALSNSGPTGAAAGKGAEYSELEYVLSDDKDSKAATGPRPPGRGDLSFVPREEWNEMVGRLADSLGVTRSPEELDTAALLAHLPLHRAGGLREEPDRFVSTTLLERSSNRIKFATTTWRKRPFEEWWGETKARLNPESGIPAPQIYTLPEFSSPACVNDTWDSIHTSVPYARLGNSMIWTGTEVIVWGGQGAVGYLNTGHRYNPATDTWTSTGVDASTPTPRDGHTAVWTGTEMIVWGGRNSALSILGTGGRYNPLTDTWSEVKTDGTSPTPRRNHTAVWTGTRMIVWGGQSSLSQAPASYLSTGGVYDPASDTWTATRNDGTTTPQAREGHVAVWTGSEMIVWGGRYYWFSAPWQWGDLSTGARYNPANDTWAAIGGSTPQARSRTAAVWTGSEFIVWGGVHRDMNMFGQPTDTYLNSGGRYNPSTDSWTATRLDGTAPGVRSNHTAVWTGSELIVWGGELVSGGNQQFSWGGRYNPATNSWAAVHFPGPQMRSQHGAVWTGSEMLVWGGTGVGGTLNTGARYNPSTDSWIPTAVEPDYYGTAVWTGSEMIIWGKSSAVDTGGSPPAGLYSPATDSWHTGSGVSAPSGRTGHVAVWTGQEMIVWGGEHLNTGGRYDPTLDTWTLTPNGASTPTSRQGGPVTAVWTGTEMLIWGGFCTITGPCAGARYNPASNTWTPMRADASAPEIRHRHTATWTGTEMIIYGGDNPYRSQPPYNIGDYARYDPAVDQWTVIPAPDARAGHSAVWTGTEMILWGGFLDTSGAAINTGWRFNPNGGTFTPTSVGTGTPSPTTLHSAIWDGEEMIVWGGGGPTNDGGRYNPATDSWTATRLDGTTPQPRYGHSAVWADTEMLIWSGTGACGVTCPTLNTGGRYCACTAPVTYYQDLDGDGSGNSSQGASFCGTPAGGWVATGGDCSDQDSGNWSVPGETRNLVFTDDVTLGWSAPTAPGATSITYDLIRSSNPADFVGSGVCAVTNTTDTAATDASTPAPGAVSYYLVRAENACPGGLGSLGTNSQGAPRTALTCP